MFFRAALFSLCLPLILVASDLDVKIEKLKKERDMQELQGSNEEVEGQRFMIGDWHHYANEIEDVKVHQDKAKELTKQIDALEKQRAEQQHGEQK